MMKKIILAVFVLSLITISVPAFAQTDYTLLAPLPLSGPDSGDTEETKAGNYISGVFILIIGVAGGLAVIKIIFGGIKYMSSDAIGGKSDAKETIQNAIWGLLLAIGAWLILNTINPKLVELNLKIDAIPTTPDTTTVPTTPNPPSP